MVFSFSFKPYIAVIGDIKDSKNLKNRMQTQEKLKETLNSINQKYERNISSRFTITLGDEFQGLLCSGERTLERINEIEIEGENQAPETMINTILTLLSVIKESWSDRQREVIWDMLEHQDSQSNAADRLCIRQPTVQKILAKGSYYAYKDAMEMIDDALGEVKGK